MCDFASSRLEATLYLAISLVTLFWQLARHTKVKAEDLEKGTEALATACVDYAMVTHFSRVLATK